MGARGGDSSMFWGGTAQPVMGSMVCGWDDPAQVEANLRRQTRVKGRGLPSFPDPETAPLWLDLRSSS